MQKIIFMFDFINNGIPDELKTLVILNSSNQFYETHSSEVFHISNAKTWSFGINTLTHDGAKIWNQFYFHFILNEV